MIISLEKYEKLLEEGLILDHYFLLLSIRDGKEIPKSKRMKGFTNLLTKRGYIQEGVLTEQAMQFLTDEAITITTTSKPIDFGEWVISLHKKCQDKLKELTGNVQVISRIGNGKGYPFLCNSTDLGRKIASFINNYKFKDTEKIEESILSHIQLCSDNKEWFPLVKYYIMKDGSSDMMTNILSPVEKEIVKSSQKHI